MISNGISKLDLKRRNRMQILRLLRRNGPTSRIDIAREIGITKAAVTIITNEMIQDGILYEKGEQRNPDVRATRGRKKILLDICATYKVDLGIVLEGHSLYIGVSTLWGEVIEKQTVSVAPGASREEILIQMEEVYRQLLYKNDLKADQITGVGVCIDPHYFPLLKITGDTTLNYSEFLEYLQRFIQVPITFGTLVEGAAMAEMDYWQHLTVPSDEMLLVRCCECIEGAVVIGQELYRGSSGQAMKISEKDRNAAIEDFWQKVQKIFSPEKTPMLWKVTEGNPNRLKTLLREGRLQECDEPVQKLMGELIQRRTENLELVVHFFDPGKIVLLAVYPSEKWFADTLHAQLQKALPNYTVLDSKLDERNLFLAGAALATRAFFGDRGGY
ncbi:MAG: winged helix-turn-helix transcriptional regulator [Candidatus Merdivicinus sp.]|jgi:N-acetylglucosamine repressor